MRANKLETVLSRDRLACLAPPDMVFMYMHVIKTQNHCLLYIVYQSFTRMSFGVTLVETSSINSTFSQMGDVIILLSKFEGELDMLDSDLFL